MMRHQEVRNVMTAHPVTVTPATPLKALVEILVKQRISSIPVVSVQGKVVGVVAEIDLLKKEELQRDPDGHHLTHMTYRTRRAIATAETAGELMRANPTTVRPDATVAEAARLMDRHQVRCLPVVDENGKLLGVVGPRDLLRVFLRPDDQIQSEIIDEVLAGYLGTNPALVQVDVIDGVVRMTGELERKSMLELVLPVTRAVDGVIDADGTFTYAIDDSTLPAVPDTTDYLSASRCGRGTPGMALRAAAAKAGT
jgi:CBS domain-containing protein